MFAKRLTTLLERDKMSRGELADKLEVTVQSVGKWLKGEGGMPDYDNLYKISNIFGVSADYLLGFDSKRAKEAITNCNYSEIAKKVRNIRESKNLSPKDFAIFNDIKVKDIENIESGKPVDVDILKNIAFFSGVNFYELLGQERKLTTTDDIEYKNALNFAANLDNIEYVKLAIKAKESGVNLDEIIIAKRI